MFLLNMTPKLHVGSEIILQGLLNPETHGCLQFGSISDSRIYFLTDTHRFFLMLACCSMTFFFFFKKNEAGKLAHQLQAVTALAEDTG